MRVCPECGCATINEDYVVHDVKTKQALIEPSVRYLDKWVKGERAKVDITVPKLDPWGQYNRETQYKAERFWCAGCGYLFPEDRFYQAAIAELNAIRKRYYRHEHPKSRHEEMTEVHTKVLLDLMARVVALEEQAQPGYAPTLGGGINHATST